ncbi:hypothetical protein LUZ60_007850 [Juncus effusus]|nr:hypothetical protein LUZ60_007850 [Juncus effusus]
MRAERGGSKSSGFFNLFDWNRKSRKKLFTVSPEGSKIGRRLEESLPSTRLHMTDEEESTIKASNSSEYSYDAASSTMEDDDLLNGSKPAGVVARLMGLDSLPASAVPDPHSTPFRSFRESPLDYSTRDPLTRNPIRKMPSSPIERFQMEPIPSSARSAKTTTLSNNYHKMLLSPIKNPNFTYGRNASQIMEAAAKILEPRPEYNNVNRREKVCSVGTGRVVDPLRPEKAASRLLQLSRVERGNYNNNININNGKEEEDIVIFRPSHEINININNKNLGGTNTNGLNAKGNKGKSVSLAVQAKVNVQKREGVNLSNQKNGMTHRESCDSVGTSHQRAGTIKQQKKASTNSSSPVLRQNNQKQNCIGNRAGKSKSTPSQQGRKNETSSAKQKSRLLSKPRKENNFDLSINSNESERDRADSFISHNKDFPQKKRLIERNNNNNNNNNDKNKNKNNVLVDEYSKWNEEAKDTTDVVSFTFTSPLNKQTGESSSLSSPLVKKLGLIPVKGNRDALSLLLENKLRELGDRSKMNEKKSVVDFGKSEFELELGLEGEEIERKKKNGFEFGFDFLNDRGFVPVMEKGECSKMNDVYGDEEEMKQLSPFTVFGEESCSTSESSLDGTKVVSPSSVQAQNTASSAKLLSSETASEPLDTSSRSCFSEILDASSTFLHSDPELDYITDVIHSTDLDAQLESPLFDKLERKRSRTELERTELERTDRKLLYDCVRECLNSKLEDWNNGIGARKNKGIVEREIYKEIEGWRKMRGVDVDEVVERDMVVKREYRGEVNEIGADLEAEILDSLVNEAVMMMLLES